MSIKTKHPAYAGRDPKVWHSDLVGVVPGYPKTPEAFHAKHRNRLANAAKARAAGKLTRKGRHNGWRGRHDEMMAQRRADEAKAYRIVATRGGRDPEGYWPMPGNDAPESERDAWRADTAMAVILGIAISDTYAATERLQAAHTFLMFTTPKPTAKQAITLGSDGLEWLRQAASDAGLSSAE